MSRGNAHPLVPRCFVLAALLWIAAALGASVVRADPPAADDSRLPGGPLHEEVLNLPGDPARPVTLQVTFFKPSGAGPFPLAVMNHGATAASANNRGDRYRFTVSAYYFLSRGYAVALPMMRGFAGSGGSILHLGCDLEQVARANASDIRAVTEALGRRPDIDRTRIIVAGQSFGGWNTLGLGAAPPAGVRGLIAFNAAIRASDCATQDGSMAVAAGWLGGEATLPSLWFYGENDTVMPPATWRAVLDRYKKAGGHAELVAIGAYGKDSHQFLSFPDSLPLWAPKLDAFLRRIGLPGEPIDPEYLPHPAPPPTGWAKLTDVAAVPFLNNDGRALYQRFLNRPGPRAFVLAPNGAASVANGGYDPLGYALRHCAQGSALCRPYAVDDDVVWSGPKPEHPGEDPPRVVQKTVRMNVASSLGGFFAVNPDCSSKGLPMVSISEAPTHGTVVVGPRAQHPAFPPGNPYATCNAAMVPAIGLTYTPVPDYSGGDRLTIEETTVDGKHEVFRIELQVM
jgi:dienelactone hydrolase